YAVSLLRQGEAKEALRVIDLLEQAEKARQVGRGTFGSVELRARALEADGQGARAVALLKEYAEGPEGRPERVLVFAGLLARQKRLDDALDVCAKAWKTCPPEAVGGACVAALRAGKPSEAQTARVEKWLKAACAAKPESPALWVQFADLLDVSGRLE